MMIKKIIVFLLVYALLTASLLATTINFINPNLKYIKTIEGPSNNTFSIAGYGDRGVKLDNNNFESFRFLRAVNNIKNFLEPNTFNLKGTDKGNKLYQKIPELAKTTFVTEHTSYEGKTAVDYGQITNKDFTVKRVFELYLESGAAQPKKYDTIEVDSVYYMIENETEKMPKKLVGVIESVEKKDSKSENGTTFDIYEITVSHIEENVTLNPVLIGHSQGGLLAYEYARQYSKSNDEIYKPISAAISYSSPLQGVYINSTEFKNEVNEYMESFLNHIFTAPILSLTFGYYESTTLWGVSSSTAYLTMSEIRGLLKNSVENLAFLELGILAAFSTLGIFLSGINALITPFPLLANSLTYSLLSLAAYGINDLPGDLSDFIVNNIEENVAKFFGSSSTDDGTQEMGFNSDYMNDLKSDAEKYMNPKKQIEREKNPVAYGAIIGTNSDIVEMAKTSSTLKSILKLDEDKNEDEDVINLENIEREFSRLQWGYYATSAFDLAAAIFFTTKKIRIGFITISLPVPITDFIRIGVGVAYAAGGLKIGLNNPVKYAINQITNMGGDVLIREQEQKITILHEKQRDGYDEYRLGTREVHANHETIDTTESEETARAILELLSYMPLRNLDNEEYAKTGIYYLKQIQEE